MCTKARSSVTVSASSKSFAVSGSMVKASSSRRSTRPSVVIDGEVARTQLAEALPVERERRPGDEVGLADEVLPPALRLDDYGVAGDAALRSSDLEETADRESRAGRAERKARGEDD